MTVADKIIAAYRLCGSIKQTARELHVAEQTVRRTLVLDGEYTSSRSEEIDRLLEAGHSVDEIASELCIKPQTVRVYMQYTRGSYLAPYEQKTANAKRIIACRKRKNKKGGD